MILDGSSLAIDALVRAARDPRVPVSCAPAALAAVAEGRRPIIAVVDEYRQAHADGRPLPHVYGVTTGFGEFKKERIAPDDLEQLQQNILLSHSVGVGDTSDAEDLANYFAADVIRATLILRLNTFLKGHSGVRVELVECLLALINGGVVPLVPTKGSLGSSGDLCPLSHLFAVLLGAGRYYTLRGPGEAPTPARLRPAALLPQELGITLPRPSYKEGLALSNGATLSTALLALAIHDAQTLANTSDLAAALSLEAACGRTRALDPRVHAARGLPGQADSAANLRNVLIDSRLVDRSDEVQDVYSLRCAPQVHGAARDALAFTRMIATRELNAATDNPLFFLAGGPPWDLEQFAENRAGAATDPIAFSAGNFHGEPIAQAADFLAIAVAELANISERRTQMLLDGSHNRHLPNNLIPQRGLNSGFMLAQYCAAALVSENKVLCHPASVDSIPTGANTEDHVAMATHAARKLRTVLANAQAVLAIELLAAAQAVEWRAGLGLDPNRRPAAEPAQAEAARFAALLPDAIAARLGRGTAVVYQGVRAAAARMLADRPLDGDIRAVRQLVESGYFVEAVNAALEAPLRRVAALCVEQDVVGDE